MQRHLDPELFSERYRNCERARWIDKRGEDSLTMFPACDAANSPLPPY